MYFSFALVDILPPFKGNNKIFDFTQIAVVIESSGLSPNT